MVDTTSVHDAVTSSNTANGGSLAPLVTLLRELLAEQRQTNTWLAHLAAQNTENDGHISGIDDTTTSMHRELQQIWQDIKPLVDNPAMRFVASRGKRRSTLGNPE